MKNSKRNVLMASARLMLLFCVCSAVLSALCIQGSVVVLASDLMMPGDPEWINLSLVFSGSASVSGTISHATLSTYSIPQNDNRQTASCSVKTLEGEEGNRYAKFEWNAGESPSDEYSCNVMIDVNAASASLTHDEPYPVVFPEGTVPAGFDKYLTGSEFVVINDDIRHEAELVTKGASGEFDAASRVCGWVNSVMTYDSALIDSIVPSDKVFIEHRGACDEYSHLALAMLRSLGIPSRYAAGYAYGGSRREGSFGPHAWIEVYFPNGGGWIPFDPTYAQLGFIDSSHVKFYHSVDESFNVKSTEYNYPSDSQKPIISWTDSEPVITILKSGAPFTPFSAKIVGANSSVMNIGESVLVEADFRNDWTRAMCEKVAFAYKTDILRPSQNLKLDYGEDDELACAFPGKSDRLRWVVGGGTAGYEFTIRAYAGSLEFDQASISIYDSPVRGSLSSSFEKSSYTEGEPAVATVSAKAGKSTGNKKGTISVMELSTGEVKNVESGGDEKTLEFTVPASDDVAFYSPELFAFTKPDAVLLAPGNSIGFDASIYAPKVVVNGKHFLVNVSVTASNGTPILATVEFLGTQASGTVSRNNYTFTFNTSLSDSGSQTLEAIVRTSYGSLTLSRPVWVAEPSVLNVRFVNTAYPDEETVLVENVSVSNGELLNATLKTGWDGNAYDDAYSRVSIWKNACGTQILTLTASLKDATNATYEQTATSSIKIECGFLENIIRKIANFFSSLFAKK